MSGNKKGSATSRFKVGDKVRVKSGVSDPDFPDMPLGGWTGTVTENIDHKGKINCVFKLDDRTLANLHPVYRKRCERDGLDFETMGLGEEELELDDGSLVAIEQPPQIETPPLSEKDQDDRIRVVFGLTHDDPLPLVSPETLTTYCDYLAANLKLPIVTSYWEESSAFTRKKISVSITELEAPVEEEFDEECGLFGIAAGEEGEIDIPLESLDLKKQDPNYRLISDYTYWSQTWR
jgi:hypothetical protein